MTERVSAEVIYNSLLKNDDAFTHLQYFVQQAEAFYAKDSDYDLVKEYLCLSGNCHELEQYVKELATCDSMHAMALLDAMCHILIRLASDLPVFIAAGNSIVNEMLSYGMKTIFNFLKMKQKSSRTKSALHFLTAMIALGNQTAHQVVAKLNFSSPHYLHLLNRTNFSENEDVRTAFLNLIVLVITVCNNNIIRQIVEVKGFLNSIFPGLISDRVSIITLLLNTFRQFIIENNSIPKTTKLHLFNDYSLKPVIQLYTWKGPVRVKKHGKRKLGEEKYLVAYDVSTEELEEVRSCAHEFMLALCCSHKNGIIFLDTSCGVSGRNYNNVITNILKSFPKPYMDPLMSSFVLSVLQACPDQMKQYLTIFKESLVPRLSTSWLNIVEFLEKILKSQNVVQVLFKSEIKRSVTALVTIAKTFSLLDILVASEISEAFNSGHRVLCYHLSRFLLNILTQVKAVVVFCDLQDSSNAHYDASELSNFKFLFLSSMFSCFPTADKLQKYWHKISYEKSITLLDEAVKDLPIPTFSEELSTLIQVIKFYKTFSSELNREFDFDLSQMLNDLKNCESDLSRCDLNKVYSNIIDFCSEEYAISLWNKISFERFCSENSTCTCDEIICKNLIDKSMQLKIKQLLSCIDSEVKSILKKKSKDCALVTHVESLKQLLSCLSISNDEILDYNEKSIKTENSHIIPKEIVVEIFKDFFSHPTILRLFLFDVKISENKSEHLNNSVVLTTKLILDVVQNVLVLPSEMVSSFLMPFKKKVLKYLCKCLKSEIESSVELVSIIGTFSSLFETSDIQVLLENSLIVQSDDITDLNEYCSSLCLLLQTFIEKDGSTHLSSDSINDLISKFVSLPKKKKKILRQYLLNLLQKNPIYGHLITEDSALLLLTHKSSKDLAILGTLIDHSERFRKITQSFIREKFDESDSTEYMYLVSRCLCNCSEDKEDSDFKDSVSSKFCSYFEELVFRDISADLDGLLEFGIGKAMQLLFRQIHSSPKKLQDFCKLIMKNSENEMPSPSKMLIILQLFDSWKFYSHETNKVKTYLLKVCCLWLLSGLNENSFICPQLFNFIKELLQSMNDCEISQVVDITEFFTKCLKFALKCADIGKDLLKILSLLSEKSNGDNLPVQSLHGLLTGHSQFFKIMLSEEGVKDSLKETLIDLLIILTKLDGTVCKENHIGLLLSAYGASMASADQKLLYLLKIYADNNADMSQYSPFLWGKAAISHYSIMKTSQNCLWKQPKLQDILSLLYPDKIENTLLHFPLHMKLKPTPELVEIDEHLAVKVYDMRFFLPLFANLLSPGAFVHCSQFIQSKALQLIFISLSSMEPLLRALSLYCLSQFYQHLEGAYFREKGIWLCLLDSLRNSIASTNPKIPNIVSLFLARATDIFTKPEHKLYRPLYTFILKKPVLDIAQVPEFYNLFNSSYVEHRILRLWLLNLLGDGLRSSLDFHICEKRYIFSTLLNHYVSCLSTNQEKVAILQSLNSAVKIKSSAHTLCQKGLLVWLQKVVEERDQSEAELSKSLYEVIKNLEITVPDFFNFSLISKIKKKLQNKSNISRFERR